MVINDNEKNFGTELICIIQLNSSGRIKLYAKCSWIRNSTTDAHVSIYQLID